MHQTSAVTMAACLGAQPVERRLCLCHLPLWCPHIVQSAAAADGDAAATVDEAEEAAVDQQLAQLRRQIVAAKQTGGLQSTALPGDCTG